MHIITHIYIHYIGCAKLSMILMNKTPQEAEDALFNLHQHHHQTHNNDNRSENQNNHSSHSQTQTYTPLSQIEKEQLWNNLKWSCK